VQVRACRKALGDACAVYVEVDDHLRHVEEMAELDGSLVAKAEYSEAELLASRASTAVDRAKTDLEAALLPSGRTVEPSQLPIALTVTRTPSQPELILPTPLTHFKILTNNNNTKHS
jgi:hypothetical protein